MYDDNGRFRVHEKVKKMTYRSNYVIDSTVPNQFFVYTLITFAHIIMCNSKIQTSWQLCIGLNNMYHVRKALISMPSSMELEKYYKWLHNEEGIGERVI